MGHITNEPKTRTDWYEEVCQQLDALKRDSVEFTDENDVLPPGRLFEFVKEKLQDLRQLANFPCIRVPDVWLGPNGQIGLTWDAQEHNFDLIFGTSKITARWRVGSNQTLIEPKDVLELLALLP